MDNQVKPYECAEIADDGLPDEQSILLSQMKDIPQGCDLSTLHDSGELNQYRLGEEKASLKNDVSDAYARNLRHAYFAFISYVDAQIGKILQTLKEAGQTDNTIIVLLGGPWMASW